MAEPVESQNDANLNAPVDDAFAITPHDTNYLSAVPRGIYVGVGGDIRVDMAGTGDAITFKNVATGSIMPIRVTRVYDTGTDATNLVALR